MAQIDALRKDLEKLDALDELKRKYGGDSVDAADPVSAGFKLHDSVFAIIDGYFPELVFDRADVIAEVKRRHAGVEIKEVSISSLLSKMVKDGRLILEKQGGARKLAKYKKPTLSGSSESNQVNGNHKGATSSGETAAPDSRTGTPVIEVE